MKQHQLSGEIRSMAALHRPIHATLKGDPVKVVALGDIQGASPAAWIVDREGSLYPVATENVTVNDPEFLPNPAFTGSGTPQRR